MMVDLTREECDVALEALKALRLARNKKSVLWDVFSEETQEAVTQEQDVIRSAETKLRDALAAAC